MSCAKWEQSIYLYDELKAKEKAAAEAHVASCAACTALLQNIQEQQKIILDVSKQHAQPAHPEILTNRIMREVMAGRNTSPWRETISRMFLARTALGAASLTLVILFFLNQRAASDARPATNVQAAAVLDSQAFNKSTVAAIATPKKQPLLSLADCARSANCDNDFIKHFRIRMNQN